MYFDEPKEDFYRNDEEIEVTLQEESDIDDASDENSLVFRSQNTNKKKLGLKGPIELQGTSYVKYGSLSEKFRYRHDKEDKKTKKYSNFSKKDEYDFILNDSKMIVEESYEGNSYGNSKEINIDLLMGGNSDENSKNNSKRNSKVNSKGNSKEICIDILVGNGYSRGNSKEINIDHLIGCLKPRGGYRCWEENRVPKKVRWCDSVKK